MPEFKLNKLVRDKLPYDYKKLGQVAKYKELTLAEHEAELINKLIEEADEMKAVGSIDEIKSEIADVQQALDDLIKLYDINPIEISKIQQKKFDKKGGFSNGFFVETIKLNDDDEWVSYYRANSDIFPEV